MNNRLTLVAATAIGASALLAPATGSAQGADAWQFQATLYGYLPTISGSSSFPDPGGSSLNLDIDTILDKLKMAFMGSFEARRGRWGGFTDIIYMNLGDSKSGTRDLGIGGSELPAGVSANLDYDLKAYVWTLAGTYRAISTPQYTMDVLGGARNLNIDQKLGWSLTGNLGSIALPDRAGTRKTSLQNWDAIVGVKGRASLGADGKWFMPYYVDLGAGESQFTWQAMAGLGYAFQWGDVVGTWRYTDYQMKSGKVVEDLTMSGPAIAAIWRW